MPLPIAQFQGGDDQELFTIRRDVSGGMNNRQHGTIIAENQVESITNGDLEIPGQSQKRKGKDLIEDLGDNGIGVGAFGFEPTGGTNELLVIQSTKLEGWTGAGSFTTHDSGFTTNLQTQMFKVFKSGADGDVVMIQNGTDNAHEMKQDNTVTDLGNGSDDPPITKVNAFFRGRWFALKDNLMYFSDAYPTDYAGAWDQNTNAFSMPVGTERALIGLRDTGIVALGEDSVWGINPSVVPQSTDKAEKIIEIGCVANKTAKQVGDDIYFLARDGVRGVFRTLQDKIQLGQSFPLSFPLKDEFESIAWSNIDKATAIWFDNKYFIALPVDGSSTNNEVWIYYPSLNAWAVASGWNVGDWAKIRIDGEERLFYIDSTEDIVYRAWILNTDDNKAGTAGAVTYTEIGRKEDMGQPLKKKIGGDILIKFSATSGTATITAAFDDGVFEDIGTLDVGGNNITFPTTFPVNFLIQNIAFDKFPIDSNGSWYTLQLKIVHSDSTALKVLERTIVTRLEEYKSDDNA